MLENSAFFSEHPESAHSYFDFLLHYFQVSFIISSQLNHPTLFVTPHLQRLSLPPRSASPWPISMLSSLLPSHFY